LKTVLLYLSLAATLLVSSCKEVDLYEKQVIVSGHHWKSGFQPEFEFEIKDSNALYQLFFLLRHNEKYGFNNIWVNLYSTPPGDSLRKVQYEIPLATDSKGWLASGMDDIYDHRYPLTGKIPLRPGIYKFKLEQIMREDPLKEVMNVGLRLEKTK